MKRFISLVNTSIPLGRVLNALAHCSVGIGHLLPKDKMPNILVVFADESTIRNFRQESQKLLLAHPNDTIYSDFTNTMTVGSTETCIKTTRETPDDQLIYYAVSLCTEENLLESQEFEQIIGRCKILKDYQPYIASENTFAFNKVVDLPDYQLLPTKKMSLVLDRARPISELVNAAVISSLCIGMQADLNELKLLIYTDADGQKHSYISYHPFPILAARHQAKFNDLVKEIEKDQDLLVKLVRDKEGNTVSVCILGLEDQVNAHTRQKFISLWTAELPEDAFVLS